MVPSRSMLVLRAWWLLGRVRLGLCFLPYAELRRRLDTWAARGASDTGIDADRLMRAVARASRWVPGARTCLPRALAADAWLRRNGHRSVLHIGASRQRGIFEAHAWVEHRGRVVMGQMDGSGLERFTPLA